MPELHDDVEANDGIKGELKTESTPTNRRDYRVLSEAGLFKNGKQYDQGEIVSLDPVTARRFIEIGEVEEVEADSE